MKTLLIDDDPFALKVLARQLEQLGCGGVAMCTDAKEAMTRLESPTEAIGLIFCDLQMPDIDGVEFVRHLAHIGYRGGLVLVSGEDGRILQIRAEARAGSPHPHPRGPAKADLGRSTARLGGQPCVSQRRGTRGAGPLFEPDELERAIAGGELINHYQPKVELASGAMIGVETLVRWQHPQAGLVFPDQFIALAEDHGLINGLTRAVLAAALRQARLWQDAGLGLQVAVNISMGNLGDLDFPDVVARLASDAGVALQSLVLEVTESRLMKDARTPLDILTRLRLKRIGLSIDDFGTGHSSLIAVA